MAQKQYIGIKRIWYLEPITGTTQLTAAQVKAALAKATEVKNSHQDTWGYEESDPEKTEYVNELNGQTYYVDVTKGSIPTVSFTMGEYDYADKAALQGGKMIDAAGATVTDATKAVGWVAPEELTQIEKAIIAQTKTGNYVVLTRSAVTAKGNFVEKNIGLGVSAAALENTGIGSVVWFDKAAIEAAAPPTTGK